MFSIHHYKSGARATIVSGLNFPTAITFGPDNKLYISNAGFGPTGIGGGQIVQASIYWVEQTAKKGS